MKKKKTNLQTVNIYKTLYFCINLCDIINFINCFCYHSYFQSNRCSESNASYLIPQNSNRYRQHNNFISQMKFSATNYYFSLVSTFDYTILLMMKIPACCKCRNLHQLTTFSTLTTAEALLSSNFAHIQFGLYKLTNHVSG